MPPSPAHPDLKREDTEVLLRSLESLYRDPKYSDLTIVCGTEKFAVHRCIVCPRSQFFARACDGDYQESASREIHLPDDDPIVVKKVIQYLYTLDYSVPGKRTLALSGIHALSGVKAKPRMSSMSIHCVSTYGSTPLLIASSLRDSKFLLADTSTNYSSLPWIPRLLPAQLRKCTLQHRPRIEDCGIW
ncbi:hypothetical protein VTN49DRAFT_3412 [Thermomyces lanuginosus]|uniref:uncharacterized protein n=1 Tax=Thermomyces lanuginosus TaxID=5541 RepID=UPI0037436BAB